MQYLRTSDGPRILKALIETIQDNRAYLSELDGAIGDGDHGINMSKGFGLAGEQLGDAGYDLSTALDTLGTTLMMEIGGAMGPLYGSLFMAMAAECQGREQVDAALFGSMLEAARRAVSDLASARVGDKTLMDTLVPAAEAYAAELAAGGTFRSALVQMERAAEAGKESTRDLVARIGRASRLGERSRGHLDAGATSCWLILSALGQEILRVLVE
ncbi:MAG: dihydroxyacetone kinase subunit L [Chloroflexi bacterium]|nr:dihydroxyacetone kinase subunit L [Chloroflexota bacterium]